MEVSQVPTALLYTLLQALKNYLVNDFHICYPKFEYTPETRENRYHCLVFLQHEYNFQLPLELTDSYLALP